MQRSRIIRWGLAAGVLAGVMIAGPNLTGARGDQAPRQAGGSGLAWTIVDDSAIAAKPSADAVSYKTLSSFTALRLDQSTLESQLEGAPNEDAPVEGATIISLPDPNGILRAFDVSKVAIYEPELAAELPGFNAYTGTATDDSGATIRFEVTPYGFHAQVIDEAGWWYIDPYFHLDTSLYVSYYKRDLDNIHGWNESPNWADEVVAELGTIDLANLDQVAVVEEDKSGTQLRTYRIAITTDDQYSTFHGGTVPQVASAITTVLNRINGIYVREVAIRFTLVGNNNSLIYLTDAPGGCPNPPVAGPNCDPHSSNDLATVQATIDNVIGDANYDIGHMFNRNCGLARTPSVGQSGSKARGCSGINSPVGDPFVVDFVAHEIGHQFGANHTFNGTRGNCAGSTRNDATAYEPGSGTTIMAYAGICGLDDVQDGNASSATGSSDSHFFSSSIDEILNWSAGGPRSGFCDISGGGGNFCANLGATASGNTVPTANAGPDGAIPRGTPFRLNGGGTDANGESLTFQWDQRNLGGAGRALDNPEINIGPLFRAQPPSAAATRFLPKLAEVVAGNTNQNGACPALTGAQGPSQRCWSEFIPTVDRSMDFRVIVRDNNTTAGGLADDDMNVSVSGPPFRVLTPNGGGAAWTGGTQQTVTWDPAQTTLPPVSTPTVNIRLSTDGGATFPFKLIENTPNDGTEQVTVPFIAAPSQGRIMVEEYIGADECAPGVVFYDVSDANFTLNPGGPPAAAPNQPSCWTSGNNVPPPPSDFVAITPTRLIDTRGQPRSDEAKVGSLDGSAGPLKFNVLGKGGVPMTGVGAVSLNVTAVNGEQPTGSNGFVTVDGCATPRPDASNINFSSPAATPNAVITPISATGDVCVYVFGIADILVDINGYFPTTSSFKAITPARIVDTRGASKVGSLDGSAGPLKLSVYGLGGLPLSDIGALSLNVTAVNGEQPTGSNGFVTVDGCASPRPDASNINFTTNAATPNAVITPVSTSGDLCVYVFGLADILVDVNGYFPTTSSFKAITPSRLVDTRGGSKVGSLDGSAGPLVFNVLGKSGIPSSGVGAVTLNVTAVNGEQPTGSNGFVTVDGCATPRPDASNINYTSPAATPNAVITPVSSGGDVCVYVFGRSDILVDANGYFPD